MKKYFTLLSSIAIIAFSLSAKAQTYQWTKSGGGGGTDDGTSITTDGSGFSYICGTFSGRATFATYNLVGSGWEVFIAGYTAATGGCGFAIAAGGAGNQQSSSMQYIGGGTAYITGRYSGTAVFGTTTLTSNGGFDDIFVAKYDAVASSWLWARSVGGTNWDYGMDIVRVNASADMYVTGLYQNSATFGTTTLTSAGATDVFTARIDQNGNWLWAKSGGGNGYDYGNSIISDNTG